MEKKKGEHEFTVPQTDLSLEDLPVDQERVDALHEAAMFARTPEATWRHEVASIFLRAKREGLAKVAHLWRRPRRKRAGAPDLYLKNDLAQRQWLIEQMADGLSYHPACRKAEDEGRIGGGVTEPGSKARRLAGRFDRRTMEAAARALQKQRSSI